MFDGISSLLVVEPCKAHNVALRGTYYWTISIILEYALVQWTSCLISSNDYLLPGTTEYTYQMAISVSI